MGKNVLNNLKMMDTSYLLDPTVVKDIEDKAADLSADDIKKMDIDLLVPFKDHPFHVDVDNPKFKELIDSIEEHGILQPVLVRHCGTRYEIIAGHCRTEAAKILGMKQIPVKIMDLDDAMATVIMVHSNVYARDKISIIEKVKAYRMCFDAEAESGKSRSQTAAVIGAGKDSKRQVYRYVRLSHLSDDLLELLDQNRISIDAGVELAYIDDLSQEELYRFISGYSIYPNVSQAKIIRAAAQENPLSYEAIISLLVEAPKPKMVNKVTFKTKDLQEYFDDDTPAERMTDVIRRLLEKYKAGEIDIND